MKKIFISGKIVGNPVEECLNKFFNAGSYLRRTIAKNWHPTMDGNNDVTINPLYMEGIYFGIPREEAKEIYLKELKTCTHIYMLKDWKESEEAKEQHEYAKDHGIEIVYQ